MRRIFILHADHEQNASTSTVRLAGSSGANPFACIAAGIACLWGPAHGGANEAALNMLREIGNVKRIPEYIARAKDKDDPFRLMGFGHRVYKNFDPRAKVMKETAEEVLKELGISDPVLDVAQELEQIALKDEYFIEKKLYPNVDFYSGVILNAIGFPTDMFTALVRARPHRRLGRAVERDDLRPRAEDRPPAPALHRRDAARLCARSTSAECSISRFNRAIVREPARSVVDGLRFEDRGNPTYECMREEHSAYTEALRSAGVDVTCFPRSRLSRTSMFVEDPALVFSEGAILLRPGAPTRIGEADELAPAIRDHFELVIELPLGFADGGDVLVTPDL